MKLPGRFSMKPLLRAQLGQVVLESVQLEAVWPEAWGGGSSLVNRMPVKYLVVKTFWKHDDHEHGTPGPALSLS